MIEPLVSPEIDLRDFPFMPVDIGRLFGSEFHAQSDDGAWRAGVTLWLKSYHQVPAASIPDDDVALARLAELGRDVKAWRRIKDAALRGWVKCSDGRLYHPVVAEKALEGWIEKLGQRKSSAAGNAKRYGQTFNPSPFDTSIEDAVGRLSALNPSSRLLAKRLPKTSRKSPDGSSDGGLSGSQGTGKGQGREEDNPPLSSNPSEGEGEISKSLERFLAVFPTTKTVSRPRVWDLLASLGKTDVEAAISGASAYAESYRKDPTTRPVGAEKFIRDRLFDNFSAATIASTIKTVFIKIDDLRWNGLVALHVEKNGKGPPTANGGWHFPAEWVHRLTEAPPGAIPTSFAKLMTDIRSLNAGVQNSTKTASGEAA